MNRKLHGVLAVSLCLIGILVVLVVVTAVAVNAIWPQPEAKILLGSEYQLNANASGEVLMFRDAEGPESPERSSCPTRNALQQPEVADTKYEVAVDYIVLELVITDGCGRILSSEVDVRAEAQGFSALTWRCKNGEDSSVIRVPRAGTWSIQVRADGYEVAQKVLGSCPPEGSMRMQFDLTPVERTEITISVVSSQSVAVCVDDILRLWGDQGQLWRIRRHAEVKQADKEEIPGLALIVQADQAVVVDARQGRATTSGYVPRLLPDGDKCALMCGAVCVAESEVDNGKLQFVLTGEGLVKAMGSFRLRVVDAVVGGNVSHASVSYCRAGVRVECGSTGRLGDWCQSCVPAGPIEIRVWKDGYSEECRRIEINPDDEPRDEVIALYKCAGTTAVIDDKSASRVPNQGICAVLVDEPFAPAILGARGGLQNGMRLVNFPCLQSREYWLYSDTPRASIVPVRCDTSSRNGVIITHTQVARALRCDIGPKASRLSWARIFRTDGAPMVDIHPAGSEFNDPLPSYVSIALPAGQYDVMSFEGAHAMGTTRIVVSELEAAITLWN